MIGTKLNISLGKVALALLLLLGLTLGGCGSKGTAPEQEVELKPFSYEETEATAEEETSMAAPEETPLPEEGYALSVDEGKTWMTIAVDEGVDVTPEKQDSTLRLTFSPPSTSVDFSGFTSQGAVENVSMEPGPMMGTMQALDITLAEESEFLLQPEDGTVKVLFVPKGMEQAAAPAEDEYVLKNIEFTKDKEGWFYIKLKADTDIDYFPRPGKEGQVRLIFPDLEIPEAYTKIYRLHKFGLGMKSALLQNTEEGAELLISMTKRSPMHVERAEGELIFKLLGSTEGEVVETPVAEAEEEKAPVPQLIEQEDEALEELNTLFPGMRRNYVGDPISINLQDADVELVLRLIAEVSGYNLILDEGVTGDISLKLDNVPWDQALDLVLMQKDLGMVLRGNIMRIATKQKLQQEQKDIQEARKAALEAREALKELEPLQTEFIQINYAKSAELMPQLKEFIGERGKISNDARTNTLIVSATRQNIKSVRSVVDKLDRPEKQVLIEARVVYATDDFQKSLGLRWGGGFGSDLDEEYQWEVYGSHSGQSNFDQDFTTYPSNPVVNVPGTLTQGGIGLTLAKMGGTAFTLDAQLQLGEEKGKTRVVSSPRVVTLNNQQAEIMQGTKIALETESASGGTTIEYEDAVLRLTVTPQITPDNKLILDIFISDDSPSPGSDNIDTRSATTKLIVDDGETLVIGGVNKTTETVNQERVPVLHRIPLLGWLFKNKTTEDDKEELLIFIRPRVL